MEPQKPLQRTHKLTTAQHAHLIALQQAVDAAIRERDGFVMYLGTEHGVTAQTHTLDLATGEFVPVENKNPDP